MIRAAGDAVAATWRMRVSEDGRMSVRDRLLTPRLLERSRRRRRSLPAGVGAAVDELRALGGDIDTPVADMEALRQALDETSATAAQATP